MDEVKIDPHEMLRLRDMLDVAGVRYVKNDERLEGAGGMRWQTKSPDFRIGNVAHGFSVVLAPYSYGGVDGRLEAWVDGMEGPFGYLTADEVMEKLRQWMGGDE